MLKESNLQFATVNALTDIFLFYHFDVVNKTRPSLTLPKRLEEHLSPHLILEFEIFSCTLICFIDIH
jgi:hypothetical protein